MTPDLTPNPAPGQAPDLPSVKLTASVDEVLAALAAAQRRKLSAADIVRTTGVGRATVNRALVSLKAARLAQAMDQAHIPDKPVHLVWWLTGAGEALATQRAQGRG